MCWLDKTAFTVRIGAWLAQNVCLQTNTEETQAVGQEVYGRN